MTVSPISIYRQQAITRQINYSEQDTFGTRPEANPRSVGRQCESGLTVDGVAVIGQGGYNLG